MYKAAEQSDKAIAFIMQNLHDLSIRTESGVVIHVIEKDNNKLQIMIGVGEETTSEALHDAIPLAIDWRNRLLEWQGRQPTSTDVFLFELHRLNQEGTSPAELAKQINQKVAGYLREYHQYWQERAAMLPQIRGGLGLLRWALNAGFDPFALHHARDLLRAIGFRDDEIGLHFTHGLKRIDDRETPFLVGEPVSGDKVREKLRYWRKNKKYQISDSLE